MRIVKLRSHPSGFYSDTKVYGFGVKHGYSDVYIDIRKFGRLLNVGFAWRVETTNILDMRVVRFAQIRIIKSTVQREIQSISTYDAIFAL